MGSVPYVVEDCMGVLQVLSDGSIHRADDVVFNFPFNFPTTPKNDVVFEDRLFDPDLNLHLRLYRPSNGANLPVILYLHGGGFCVGSRAWPNCHNCCLRLAASLGAVVVAPDYRLAPEHRLPAAVDDALRAVAWLGEAELVVDLDRVFVVGDSSGGNIGHHVAVRVGTGSSDTGVVNVKVRGYVLLAPFFGGVERTESEEGPSESMLNLDTLDRFWRLSIPIGETRDHPYANPFGPNSPNLESVPMEPMLVIVGGNELLRDRVEDYSNKLKALGKKVEFVEFQGLQHGFFTNDPYSQVSDRLLEKINHFMSENSS